MKYALPRAESIAQPDFILHEERKYLLVGYCVPVGNDDKFLAVLHEKGYILTKQREGRISYHYIRVLEQLDAFGTSEVAVPMKFSQRSRKILQCPYHVVAVSPAVIVVVPKFTQSRTIRSTFLRRFVLLACEWMK